MTHAFQWWMDDPQGGQHSRWSRIRIQLEEHDQTCKSLSDPWLPREGGVSCPSDLLWCEDCNVSFFNEVLYAWPDWNAEDPEWLCECCKRKRMKLQCLDS